jgi:hypothetical protein
VTANITSPEIGNYNNHAAASTVTASMFSQGHRTGNSSSQDENRTLIPTNKVEAREHHDAEVANPAAGNRSNPPAKPISAVKEWLSWKLRCYWMVTLLFVEVGIIAAIFYLERRSTSDNGIASVPQVSTSSVSSHFAVSSVWTYGLLWTTLPSLGMTLYRIVWGMLVSATADRQPSVELLPQQGKMASNVNVTVILDYRSYPSFFNWWFAFRNRHIVLGFGMILSLLLSIGVIPLTLHLFVTALSQLNSTILLNFSTTFDE